MLYFNLVDICFFLVGLFIGVALMSCIAASGADRRCEDCVLLEILQEVLNEREE